MKEKAPGPTAFEAAGKLSMKQCLYNWLCRPREFCEGMGIKTNTACLQASVVIIFQENRCINISTFYFSVRYSNILSGFTLACVLHTTVTLL